mgnify:FL=1
MTLSSNSPIINKVDTYVGFAVKSGRVIWGLDMLKKAKKAPFVILIDERIGQNSLKQVNLYAERNSVPIVVMPAEHLNNSLARTNVKILSVCDENLAKAILNTIK